VPNPGWPGQPVCSYIRTEVDTDFLSQMPGMSDNECSPQKAEKDI